MSLYYLHEGPDIFNTRTNILAGAEYSTRSEMKPKKAAVEGENITDLCGGSDLTAENMAEGSSRTTSSSLNYGSTIKLDTGTVIAVADDQSSEALAKFQAAEMYVPSRTREYNDKPEGQSSSVPGGSAANQVIQTEETVYGPRGSRIMGGIMTSTAVSSSLKLDKDCHSKGEDWLELGLGSSCGNHHQAKQKKLEAKTRSLKFIDDEDLYSRQRRKPDHAFKLWSEAGTNKEIQKDMGFSITNLHRDDARQVINNSIYDIAREVTGGQREIQCPYPNAYLQIGHQLRDASFPQPFTLMSTNCNPSFWQNNRMSFCTSEPEVASTLTLHASQGTKQVSEQRNPMGKRSGGSFLYPNSYQSQDSALLQQAIDRIQSRAYPSNGDFAWSKSINFGSVARPSISEIASRRLLSGAQCLQRPQYMQPISIYHPTQNETPKHLSGQPYSAAGLAENARVSMPAARRPQPGLWFTLQVAHTQNEDCMLPQIPKTYLRIKDGTMTIMVVKKYLASKLGLNSESEIDITCKGQCVPPFMTLQHVRDVIWFSGLKKHEECEEMRRDISNGPLLSINYSCNEHLMVLHYQRHWPPEIQTSNVH